MTTYPVYFNARQQRCRDALPADYPRKGTVCALVEGLEDRMDRMGRSNTHILTTINTLRNQNAELTGIIDAVKDRVTPEELRTMHGAAGNYQAAVDGLQAAMTSMARYMVVECAQQGDTAPVVPQWRPTQAPAPRAPNMPQGPTQPGTAPRAPNMPQGPAQPGTAPRAPNMPQGPTQPGTAPRAPNMPQGPTQPGTVPRTPNMPQGPGAQGPATLATGSPITDLLARLGYAHHVGKEPQMQLFLRALALPDAALTAFMQQYALSQLLMNLHDQALTTQTPIPDIFDAQLLPSSAAANAVLQQFPGLPWGTDAVEAAVADLKAHLPNALSREGVTKKLHQMAEFRTFAVVLILLAWAADRARTTKDEGFVTTILSKAFETAPFATFMIILNEKVQENMALEEKLNILDDIVADLTATLQSNILDAMPDAIKNRVREKLGTRERKAADMTQDLKEREALALNDQLRTLLQNNDIPETFKLLMQTYGFPHLQRINETFVRGLRTGATFDEISSALNDLIISTRVQPPPQDNTNSPFQDLLNQARTNSSQRGLFMTVLGMSDEARREAIKQDVMERVLSLTQQSVGADITAVGLTKLLDANLGQALEDVKTNYSEVNFAEFANAMPDLKSQIMPVVETLKGQMAGRELSERLVRFRKMRGFVIVLLWLAWALQSGNGSHVRTIVNSLAQSELTNALGEWVNTVINAHTPDEDKFGVLQNAVRQLLGALDFLIMDKAAIPDVIRVPMLAAYADANVTDPVELARTRRAFVKQAARATTQVQQVDLLANNYAKRPLFPTYFDRLMWHTLWGVAADAPFAADMQLIEQGEVLMELADILRRASTDPARNQETTKDELMEANGDKFDEPFIVHLSEIKTYAEAKLLLETTLKQIRADEFVHPSEFNADTVPVNPPATPEKKSPSEVKRTAADLLNKYWPPKAPQRAPGPASVPTKPQGLKDVEPDIEWIPLNPSRQGAPMRQQPSTPFLPPKGTPFERQAVPGVPFIRYDELLPANSADVDTLQAKLVELQGLPVFSAGQAVETTNRYTQVTAAVAGILDRIKVSSPLTYSMFKEEFDRIQNIWMHGKELPLKKPAPDGTAATATINARALYTLYKTDGIWGPYYFPRETITYLYSPTWKTLAGQTRVYYEKDADAGLVNELMDQREPTNIAMDHGYDEDGLNQLFGWRYSKYITHYDEHRELAPNIGVYCLTPLLTTKQMIHVYNAIGYAFDSEEQPDYQALINNVDLKGELTLLYTRVLYRVFVCAQDLGLTTTVMSYLGGSAFARLLRKKLGMGDAQLSATYYFADALNNAIELSGYKGAVLFMGSHTSDMQTAITPMPYKDIGFFPDCVSQVQVNTTLFVNAWDPHSIAGNGNEGDPSLDGYVGRVTAIALLCWPYTNPYIQRRPVDVVTPASVPTNPQGLPDAPPSPWKGYLGLRFDELPKKDVARFNALVEGLLNVQLTAFKANARIESLGGNVNDLYQELHALDDKLEQMMQLPGEDNENSDFASIQKHLGDAHQSVITHFVGLENRARMR
jgi:hypothetical protein